MFGKMGCAILLVLLTGCGVPSKEYSDYVGMDKTKEPIVCEVLLDDKVKMDSGYGHNRFTPKKTFLEQYFNDNYYFTQCGIILLDAMNKRCKNLFTSTFNDHDDVFRADNDDQPRWKNHKIYDHCRPDYVALASTFNDDYEIFGNKIKTLVIKRYDLSTALKNVKNVYVTHMEYGNYWSVVLEIEGTYHGEVIDLKYSDRAVAKKVEKRFDELLK
jgi:hypothetical protein